MSNKIYYQLFHPPYNRSVSFNMDLLTQRKMIKDNQYFLNKQFLALKVKYSSRLKQIIAKSILKVSMSNLIPKLFLEIMLLD